MHQSEFEEFRMIKSGDQTRIRGWNTEATEVMCVPLVLYECLGRWLLQSNPSSELGVCAWRGERSGFRGRLPVLLPDVPADARVIIFGKSNDGETGDPERG
jgi:hypothetical protein